MPATNYGTFFWSGLGSGSGGGGSGALAANVVALGNGVSSVSVTYSSTIAASNVPVISFINITDTYPIPLWATITAYSTTGFAATFNAATDSANYLISYIVSGVV